MLWHHDSDAPGWFHALSPVRSHGAVVGAIDLAEPPTDLRAHVRGTIRATLLTTLALSATMVLVTLLVGAWVVGRPVTALIAQARRVASGDLHARSVPHQRDELGELTRELNGMLDRLEAAAAEVRASTQQRFAALDQLRHAERLTTVGRLASSVAHELGTPLNVVAGRARLIVEDDREAAKHAGIIIDQSTRMTKIIRQLLDYARRQPPQKDAQDLRRLAAEVVTLLETLASKSGVLLRLASDLAEVPVIADPTQIQQALTNLVVNAIQASARRRHGRRDGARRGRGRRACGGAPQARATTTRCRSRTTARACRRRAGAHVRAVLHHQAGGESTGLGLSVANGHRRGARRMDSARKRAGPGQPLFLFLPRGNGMSAGPDPGRRRRRARCARCWRRA